MTGLADLLYLTPFDLQGNETRDQGGVLLCRGVNDRAVIAPKRNVTKIMKFTGKEDIRNLNEKSKIGLHEEEKKVLVKDGTKYLKNED